MKALVAWLKKVRCWTAGHCQCRFVFSDHLCCDCGKPMPRWRC